MQGTERDAASGTTEPTLEECAAVLADCRYMIVMPVPWHQAGDGSVWLDALWHRDLVRHLDYLRDLTVLAPRLPLGDPAGLVRIETGPGLRFRALPWGQSAARGLVRAPATWAAAFRAVRGADVVHSGVAGWPFPPGLFVNPLAVLLRKPMVIVVESAFWRLSGPGPHSRKARLRAGVVERFARWSVRKAALSVFTHEGYRASLARGAEARAIITPASWIDAGDVLDQAGAERAWAAKPSRPRVLLAARLTEGKGLNVLLDALARPEAAGLSLGVDVIGDGPLRPAIAEAAAALGPDRLRLLAPLPYGPPFFDLMRGYHGALVPSVTDEQPRILFDAAAQAVPMLVSDTQGHRDLVQDGINGWLFRPGDAGALLDALQRAALAGAELQRMGLSARGWAESRTHQAMHLARARRLARLWREVRPVKPAP